MTEPSGQTVTDSMRPQPVIDLATEAAALSTRVSAAIKGLGILLVITGRATDAQLTRWAEVAGIVIIAAGELASYVYTRVQAVKAARAAAAQVTPLVDPQDDRGVQLVPVDQVQQVDDPGEHTAAAILARLKQEGQT